MTNEDAQVQNLRTASYFGLEKQIRQTQEELAELIIALNKYVRSTGYGLPDIDTDDAIDGVKEELIDVTIMLDQLTYLFDFDMDELEEMYNGKIERTRERVAADVERRRKCGSD